MSEKQSIDDLFLGTVTVGERGQIVIPAELRKCSDLEPGTKLLSTGTPHNNGVAFVKLSGLANLLEALETAQKLSASDDVQNAGE